MTPVQCGHTGIPTDGIICQEESHTVRKSQWTKLSFFGAPTMRRFLGAYSGGIEIGG